MRDDQGFPVEHWRQAFPCRQRRVGPSHRLAQLLHHVLDLGKAGIIGDRLVRRPVKIKLIALQ